MKIKRRTKHSRLIIHEQWIEVTRKEGKTVSTFYPSNQELTRLLAEMNPPPDFIYRRIFLVNGVPAEYEWTRPDPQTRLLGGLFLHRMLPSDWSAVHEVESLLEEHHVRPSKNPQPRPAEYGPCPCAKCIAARESGINRFAR